MSRFKNGSLTHWSTQFVLFPGPNTLQLDGFALSYGRASLSSALKKCIDPCPTVGQAWNNEAQAMRHLSDFLCIKL